MHEPSRILARNLALRTTGASENRRSQAFARDRTLQVLVADLVAARTAAGMTQEEVARKMWTTKSAICRLLWPNRLLKFPRSEATRNLFFATR